MDIERRRSLAAAAAAVLPEVEAAVVDSWAQLVPASAAWSAAEAGRAHGVTRALLEGLVEVLAHGDVDDATWQRVHEAVAGDGDGPPDAVDELARTVRIVGVETLAERLRATIGMSGEERWALQAEAGWFLDELAGLGEEVDAGQVSTLLADLARDGPDVGA